MADINLDSTMSLNLGAGKALYGATVESNLIPAWYGIEKAHLEEGLVTADLSVRVYNIGGAGGNMVLTKGAAVIAAAGEEVEWFVNLADVDTERESYINILFSHTQNTADAPIFKIKYAPAAYDNFNPLAPPSPAVKPTTFTTQTLDAHTCATTANAWEWTIPAASKGIIAAKELPQAPFAIIGVEADDLGGASASEIAIIGIAFSYYKKLGK